MGNNFQFLMTDLEITKACAEAMGIDFSKGYASIMCPECDEYGISFDPLHDDAQAMALLKRFHLHVFIWDELPTARGMVGAGWWRIDSQDGKITTRHADLNRAICECVARFNQKNHEVNHEVQNPTP